MWYGLHTGLLSTRRNRFRNVVGIGVGEERECGECSGTGGVRLTVVDPGLVTAERGRKVNRGTVGRTVRGRTRDVTSVSREGSCA